MIGVSLLDRSLAVGASAGYDSCKPYTALNFTVGCEEAYACVKYYTAAGSSVMRMPSPPANTAIACIVA